MGYLNNKPKKENVSKASGFSLNSTINCHFATQCIMNDQNNETAKDIENPIMQTAKISEYDSELKLDKVT